MESNNEEKVSQKVLILFEFKDEAEAFISHRSTEELRSKDVCLLALMPESQAYLKKLQIPFFNTCNLFGKKGHEQVLLQSDRIYKFCEPFLKIEDDLGIKEGYKISLLFYTRLFVHYILWLTEVIERTCTGYDVKKIICCSQNKRHTTDPFLSPVEGYADEIAKRVASKLNIKFELFHIPKTGQNLFSGELKKYAREIVKYVIYQLKFRFLRFRTKNKKIILATSESYNLGRVLDKFRRTFNNAHIIYLNNTYSNKTSVCLKKLLSSVFNEVIQLPTIIAFKKKEFFKSVKNVVSKIEGNQSSSEVFTYKGIVVKDLVFQKIRSDIIPSLCSIYAQSVHLSKLLEKYRPFLIVSQMARDVDYNIGELASFYKIPSLLISHGSHVPPANEYEMIEWKEHAFGLINTQYQYVAIQSPWAKAFIDKVPIKSKQIITGPLLFANITKDRNKRSFLRGNIIPEHKNKVILLHTDTPRIRGHFRFFVYQTVDEYISSLNSLISAIEGIKDLHLIIRLRPKYFLTKEHLQCLLKESDCYSTHTEGTFEDYLSIADMLISYSSTTIEEALQNKVPVLLYDKDSKYCHIKSAQLLDHLLKPELNSCYYVGKEEALKWALGWLCRNHLSKEAPDSLWDKHVFNENEKTNLISYFSNCFAG